VKKPQRHTLGKVEPAEESAGASAAWFRVHGPSPWFESCHVIARRDLSQRNGDADNDPGKSPRSAGTIAVRVRGTTRGPEPAEYRHQHGKRIEEGQMQTHAKAGGRGDFHCHTSAGQARPRRARTAEAPQMQCEPSGERSAGPFWKDLATASQGLGRSRDSGSGSGRAVASGTSRRKPATVAAVPGEDAENCGHELPRGWAPSQISLTSDRSTVRTGRQPAFGGDTRCH